MYLVHLHFIDDTKKRRSFRRISFFYIASEKRISLHDRLRVRSEAEKEGLSADDQDAASPIRAFCNE